MTVLFVEAPPVDWLVVDVKHHVATLVLFRLAPGKHLRQRGRHRELPSLASLRYTGSDSD